MKKRVIAALMALVLIVGLVPTVIPTAQAAGITATITTSTTVGGYERGNSYGKASMSNDLRDCKWICMEPAGNPPIKGHRFRIESVKGLLVLIDI